MKKLYSLIKACMTNDMQIFKIKTKKNSKLSALIPIIIALYLMFMIWSEVNILFEKTQSMHLQFVLMSMFVFSISIFTIIEGIYKIGSLLFNCKDDQLLLSLPIKRRTVLFVRIFKFYVFELIFNSIFMIPVMIAYIRWADSITWTYYLASIIMLFILPIIPIVISCILGYITTSISSRFKYKNVSQIIISMVILLGIFYLSFNMDKVFNYIVKHATSMNDLITKIYYPAGVYAKLITDFNVIDLLVFILINIVIFTVAIFILSKFYFKINSRIKKVTTTKKTKIGKLTIKAQSKKASLIKKEINTFFKIPVFIINAGFGLVLFIVAAILVSIKFDSIIPIFTDPKGINLSKELIMNNTSILILFLILFTSYMTSITSSVISLEGKNINILKSLPVKVKTILMSKIYSCLVITTPILLVGDIILFIKFKTSIIESILIIILSVLIPLVSHFIGLLVNLKYPKLDAESETEIVKQSMSSFVSVMIGMILLIINIIIVIKLVDIINSTLILIVFTIVYLIINLLLYFILIKKGVKEFNKLSV